MKKANKKLASAIVLGLMLTVPVGASAADYGGADVPQTGSGDRFASADGNGVTNSVTNFGNIVLDGEWKNNAFIGASGGTLTVSAGNSISIQDTVEQKTFAFHGYNGTINVSEVKDVTLTNVYAGLQAQVGNGNNLGSGLVDFDLTGDLNITAHAGIIAANYNNNPDGLSATVNVDADNVVINRIDGAVGTEGGDAYNTEYGNNFAIVSVSKDYDNDQDGQYTEGFAGQTSVNIEANSIKIYADKGDEYGAILAANGKNADNAGVSLKVDDIYIEGDIVADTNANIGIGGKDGSEVHTAVIKGDVKSNDSKIGIDLGTNGSLTGYVTSTGTDGVTLNMGDGSVWNVTGNGEQPSENNLLTIRGRGIIALDVTDTANMDTVTIDNAIDADLTIAAQQNADNVADANAALQAMGAAVDGVKEGTVVKVNEGILNGESSGLTNSNGDVTDIKTNGTTSTMGNMRDLASVALVAWRQEDSTLSQRLGELRNSEGDQGIWARMSRGEFEYGGAFKNQYNYFQLGYDKAYGDWHYGAAISYNDGQTTYAQGSGENDSTSLTLYGTWLGDKGQYTDIVVKQGKINNEYTNYAAAGVTKADYDMWGTSISAEYGQKLEMKNDWYVTPQAQLTYMRIGGEDYTASVNGSPMQVSQDGMDSFVGRIGFEAGKNISDKGSVYAKASLLHEFAGEADTYLQLGNLNNSYTQDLGDTWYECGFGVNYKTSDNSYLYADVVKTFGGDVETPWQWNAGMRFSF